MPVIKEPSGSILSDVIAESGGGTSISNGGGSVSVGEDGTVTVTAAEGKDISLAGGALKLEADTEDPDTAISSAALGFEFYVGVGEDRVLKLRVDEDGVHGVGLYSPAQFATDSAAAPAAGTFTRALIGAPTDNGASVLQVGLVQNIYSGGANNPGAVVAVPQFGSGGSFSVGGAVPILPGNAGDNIFNWASAKLSGYLGGILFFNSTNSSATPYIRSAGNSLEFSAGSAAFSGNLSAPNVFLPDSNTPTNVDNLITQYNDRFIIARFLNGVYNGELFGINNTTRAADFQGSVSAPSGTFSGNVSARGGGVIIGDYGVAFYGTDTGIRAYSLGSIDLYAQQMLARGNDVNGSVMRFLNRTTDLGGAWTDWSSVGSVGGKFTVANSGDTERVVLLEGSDISCAGLTASGALITTPQNLTGAGAINLTTTATDFTSDGAGNALTLANGTAGQWKAVCHVVKGTLGTGILTPTTTVGFTTITFTNAGESVLLRYTSAGWAVHSSQGAVVA